jgi:hypothetical protein
LPFAEQLLQYGVGINEVLAFMLAVDEKADMESISRGAAAYKVIEEIRDYSQSGGLKITKLKDSLAKIIEIKLYTKTFHMESCYPRCRLPYYSYLCPNSFLFVLQILLRLVLWRLS